MSNLYLYAHIFSIALLACIFADTARKREKVSAKYLLLAIFFTECAVVFYTLSLWISEYRFKILFHELRISGVAFILVAYVGAYLEFLGRTKYSTTRNKIIVAIVPIAAVIMALTNEAHHLFMRPASIIHITGLSYGLVEAAPTVLFYLYNGYNVILFAVCAYLLAIEYLKVPRLYRYQIGLMLFPFLLSGASVLVVSVQLLGKTMFTFAYIIITMLCLTQYIAFIVYKPTRMILMAKKLVVDEVSTPIIIFDYNDVLLDANPAAFKRFSLGAMYEYEIFIKQALHIDCAFDEVDGCEVYLAGEEETYYIINDREIVEGGKYAGRVVFFNNITEMKEKAKSFQQMVFYDYMTGIYNRHAFMEKLKTLAEDHLPASVLMLNINRMKFLNNVIGTKEGDKIIIYMARKLAELVDAKGFCARTSGNEFGVVLFRSNEAEAVTIGRSIGEILSSYQEYDYTIRVSMGVAVKTFFKENTAKVVRTAMENMAKNKLSDTESAENKDYSELSRLYRALGRETDEEIQYKKQLATKMGATLLLKSNEVDELLLLCEMKNVGFVAMPPNTHDINCDHAVKGYKIALLTEGISPIANGILSHHEHYDGSGKPHGLKGENIPLLSRAMALIDFVTELSVKQQKTQEWIVEEVSTQAGQRFDPKMVDAFVKAV